MQAMRLPSVSLEESVLATTRVERTLAKSFPDEVAPSSRARGAPRSPPTRWASSSRTSSSCSQPPIEMDRADDKEELVEAMEQALHEEVPGPAFFVLAAHRAAHERADQRRALRRRHQHLRRRPGGAAQRRRRHRANPAAQCREQADVNVEQSAGLPVLRVQIDRDRIARYGIDASDVLDAVSAMGGRKVGEVFEGQRRFDLQVRYRDSARSSIEAIRESADRFRPTAER